MPNPNGTPANLSPGHKPSQVERPPNLRHGLYAAKPATLTEEAAEIVDAIMGLPHVTPADYFAAERLAMLTVSLRRIEVALGDGRVENRKRQPRALLDFQRRLSAEVREYLDRLGLTPRGRAEWVRALSGGTIADELRRRMEIGT